MSAAKAGNASAFSALVLRYQPRLQRLAANLLRDAAVAEDITQEVFVRAYRALARFDGRSQPFTWFYRITVNLSLNRLRADKKRQFETPLTAPGVEQALLASRRHGAPDQAAQQRQLRTALDRGLNTLSETLRTTLLLVLVEGLSHSEAASVLGCPEGTIAWRVHEARRQLRSILLSAGHLEGASE